MVLKKAPTTTWNPQGQSSLFFIWLAINYLKSIHSIGKTFLCRKDHYRVARSLITLGSSTCYVSHFLEAAKILVRDNAVKSALKCFKCPFAHICTSVRATTDSKRAPPIYINKFLLVWLWPVWMLGVEAGGWEHAPCWCSEILKFNRLLSPILAVCHIGANSELLHPCQWRNAAAGAESSPQCLIYQPNHLLEEIKQLLSLQL